MNFWDSLNQLIVSQESAYIAGLIAAFTPCTLALIPLFLYRFGFWEGATRISWQHSLREVALVIFGFLCSFAITGLLFQYLLGSDFVNVTRLALGMTLVYVGVLQIGGRVSLQMVQQVSHPLALGAVLPFIVSFSPCVLPFLSTLLLGSSTLLNVSVLSRFLLFGLGLLTPAIVLAFAGKAGLSLIKRTQRVLHLIDFIAPWLVIGAGLYIASQLVQLTSRDIIGAVIAAVILFAVVSYTVFKHPSRRTQFNYSMAVIVFTLIVVGSIHAYSTALPYDSVVYGADLFNACLASSHGNSPIAASEMLIFAGIGALLGVWVLRSNTISKRIRFAMGAD